MCARHCTFQKKQPTNQTEYLSISKWDQAKAIVFPVTEMEAPVGSSFLLDKWVSTGELEMLLSE
jgi:hypothetical protein